MCSLRVFFSVSRTVRAYKRVCDQFPGDAEGLFLQFVSWSILRGSRNRLLQTVLCKEMSTQLGLADYLGIDRTVLPYVIDAPVDTGLVERVQRPVDRRARKIVPRVSEPRTTQFSNGMCASPKSRFCACSTAMSALYFARYSAELHVVPATT